MDKLIHDEPLVSCIMIFLNAGESFFVEAIESVFSQTYDNWELLLVDDGSTDASTAIALRYAQQHPKKVRYLEHERHQNLGMSATRNLGVRYSKGDYIAFLDADDVWLPQKLEKQVAILEAQPQAGMVYGSTLMWFSWTNNPEDEKRDRGRHLGIQPDTLVTPPILFKLFLKGRALPPGTCSVLIRSELFGKVGGFEESFRGMYEDQAFFYKICLKVPVFIEGGCWDRYRQHPNSSCYIAESLGQFRFGEPNSAHLNFLVWLEKYLTQEAINDAEIWQLFSQVLWPYKHNKLYNLLQPYQKVKQAVRRQASQLLKRIAR